LRGVEGFESEVAAKRNVEAAIDKVARRLGNTRAVARRSYVHPAVIDAYMEHDLDAALSGEAAVVAGVGSRYAYRRAAARARAGSPGRGALRSAGTAPPLLEC